MRRSPLTEHEIGPRLRPGAFRVYTHSVHVYCVHMTFHHTLITESAADSAALRADQAERYALSLEANLSPAAYAANTARARKARAARQEANRLNGR